MWPQLKRGVPLKEHHQRGMPTDQLERRLKATRFERRNSTATGKSLRPQERVVADAVAVEPVSTVKFPANREKNREFCKIAASGAPETPNSGCRCRVSDANSLLNITGNFFGRTGNSGAGTGNFSDQKRDHIFKVGLVHARFVPFRLPGVETTSDARLEPRFHSQIN